MEKVAVDTVENGVQPAAVMRPLTDALGLTDFAVNYYELEPGDSFAFAYHSHEIQEELFYVQSGTATFETGDGDIEVGAGELVRFAPGEFQRGWNRGETRVLALAMGAPREYGDEPKLRYCERCGRRTRNAIDADDDGAARVATCEECGTETGRWVRGSMPGTVP